MKISPYMVKQCLKAIVPTMYNYTENAYFNRKKINGPNDKDCNAHVSHMYNGHIFYFKITITLFFILILKDSQIKSWCKVTKKHLSSQHSATIQ